MSVTIRFNAAACQLGQALYFARAEAFDLACPHWDALHPNTKRHYVEQAQNMLLAEEPLQRPDGPTFDLAAHLTARQATNVVGAITPSEPYGVSR